ncbi:MAG: DNA-binding domain-containing protein [Treponemataceae bacterium]|nr:MAG: DNA-binding domain-containing protein [Treponemataceae bacterium]
MAIINEVTEVLHKIEAKLYPNYLGKGDGAYVARAKAEAPLSIEDICAAAKNRGGFTGQYEDLVEHAHVLINEIVYQLLDGFSVQMSGFFSLHTRISGTYHGAHDHIGAENLHVAFRTLGRLKELLLKVQVENEGTAGDGAYIDEIIDVHTDSLNSVLTPGNMAHIMGSKIKVEGSDPAVGVWFVSQAAGNARTKVSENLGINKGTEIMALIPALSAGAYTLEIVTQYTNGTPLKNPRTIQSESVLTVA